VATRLELVREIDLRGFGGPEAYAWDVDGDGQTELVWLQDCGIFHSRIFSHHLTRWPYLRQNPVDLFCVTATTTAPRRQGVVGQARLRVLSSAPAQVAEGRTSRPATRRGGRTRAWST
jgi:hypothetical protein